MKSQIRKSCYLGYEVALRGRCVMSEQVSGCSPGMANPRATMSEDGPRKRCVRCPLPLCLKRCIFAWGWMMCRASSSMIRAPGLSPPHCRSLVSGIAHRLRLPSSKVSRYNTLHVQSFLSSACPPMQSLVLCPTDCTELCLCPAARKREGCDVTLT